MDFFIPRVIHNQAVDAYGFQERSETYTTWRGLSSTMAKELCIWANLYRTIVEKRTEKGLHSGDLCSIAGDMIYLYERMLPTAFDWFMSAPNVRQVEKFLSMAMETPCLQIQELEAPIEGQMCVLMPRVLSRSESLSDGFAREIIFSTSVDWLAFDESCNVFSGIVPFSGSREIVIKGTIIDHLDDRVRLEHVMRRRVLLKTRAGTCAENHLTEIFRIPVVDRQTLQKFPMLKKQMSFADENEAHSLHSSTDHLRSFFNNLAALTCGPTPGTRSEEPTLVKYSLRMRTSSERETAGDPSTLVVNLAGVEKDEGRNLAVKSAATAVSGADGRRSHSVTDTYFANCLGQLNSHLRHAESEYAEVKRERAWSGSKNGVDRVNNQLISQRFGHDYARKNSCFGQRKAYRTWDKSPLFFEDANEILGLEAALGLSKNYAIQAYERIAGDWQEKYDASKMCQRVPETLCDEEGSEDHREKLWQWKWRGWELEISIAQRRYSGNSISDLSRGSSGAFARPICPQAGIENNRDALKDEITDLEQGLLSPTLSSATTKLRGRESSDETWTIETYDILHETSIYINKSVTLYETVRNQFWKDYLARQKSTSRQSKSSSGRLNLSDLFPSDFDRPEQSNRGFQLMKSADILSESEGEDLRPTSSLTLRYAMRPQTLRPFNEPEPDIGSIATAIKNSLAAEIHGQDRQEKLEIRKGLLHHELMELQKSEGHRQFSGSNYDDMFLESEEGSVDDQSSDGMESRAEYAQKGTIS